MASKKSTSDESTAQVVGDSEAQIEERRKRKREATTVDGTESFPPPGMDLPDGGVVPFEDDTTDA